MRVSLRGALWWIAGIAVCLSIVRARAGAQIEAAEALRARGCEVQYQPVFFPFADSKAFTDQSQVSFHMVRRLSFVRLFSVEDVEDVVALAKQFTSIREIELCVGGSCGLSYGSGFEAAERIKRDLPGVRVRVTGNVIPVVG